MATKPKLVGTRKNTRDGSQQYTSPSLARDPKAMEKLIETARKTGVKTKPGMIGRAAAQGFMQYGASDKASKTKSSYDAKKRVGKPRGGR